jgi:transcriptional regulator with XRE-family HTH domain
MKIDGNKLKQAREAAGLTQQQLAEKAGIQVGTLSRLENGRQDNPHGSTIGAIAAALGVTRQDLMPDA